MNPAAPAQPAALIYARQSQDSKTSTDQQVAVGLARADEEGWTVHRVYRYGSSASRHATKAGGAWTELLADLDLPQVGVLWLWESSRGERTLTSWSGLLDRCRDLGVKVYVETHGRLYDVRNPREWKTLAEAEDRAYEVDKSALRIRRSVAAKAKEGQVHGRTPYGYRREYGIDEKGKRVLLGQFPDPAEAKVVKGIYDGVQRGQSLRAMAADLNARGVPTGTGTAWTPQRLRDIATMATYAGTRQHVPGPKTGHARRSEVGTLYDGVWDGIVSKAQFNQVRRLMTDPARRTSRPGRAKHLLSMFMTCAVCGGPTIVRYSRGVGAYVCQRSGHVRVPQDEVDEYVTGLLLDRLAQPEAYADLAEPDAGPRLQAARDELAEVQADYDETLKLFRDRKLSPTAFTAVEPAKLADLQRLQAQVVELETPTSVGTLLGDPSRDLATRWAEATPVARRSIVRMLFDRIDVARAPSRGHRGVVQDRVLVQWRRR
ncbi:MAG TPA: recombinase family protein [Pedococcus sp.]|nr:recombinase family protein [Pedococcus sp.]